MGESAKWLSHITVKFLDVGVVLERVLLHAAGLSLSLPPSSVPFVLLLLENAGKTFAFLPVSYLLKVAVRCPACLPCLAFLGEPADVAPAAAAVARNESYLPQS